MDIIIIIIIKAGISDYYGHWATSRDHRPSVRDTRPSIEDCTLPEDEYVRWTHTRCTDSPTSRWTEDIEWIIDWRSLWLQEDQEITGEVWHLVQMMVKGCHMTWYDTTWRRKQIIMNEFVTFPCCMTRHQNLLGLCIWSGKTSITSLCNLHIHGIRTQFCYSSPYFKCQKNLERHSCI